MKPFKAKCLRFILDNLDAEIPCTVYGFATSHDSPVAVVKFDGEERLDYVGIGNIKIESED